jgi:hypothetical protein
MSINSESETLVDSTTPAANSAFDLFELIAAILLGLGAIGAAYSGYQSSLWGGKSTEAYGLAATMATKASTEYNYAVMDMAQDYSVDIQAKKLTMEGIDATDETTKIRSFEMASYLYTVQMSETGYKDLGLPMDLREGDPAKRDDIVQEMLQKALEGDLGNDYVDLMLEEGEKKFADADKKFDEGRVANDTGDTFDLIGVIYAVGLFMAGLGLVFRTKLRWFFLAAGVLVFAYATVYMFRTPWA